MKAIEGKKRSLVWNILSEKCPHCGQDQAFEDRGIFRMPVMKEQCGKCKYHFDREPGYFIGAMYISYAIAVLIGLVTFLFCHIIFPQMSTVGIFLAVIGSIFLIAKKNYKLSRIIYIHIFPW